MHEVMLMLNWTWFPQNKVPTIEELKKEARSLLRQVQAEFKETNEFINIETGGFVAEATRFGIRLFFVIGEYEIIISDFY
jgi:hypothetical protein